MQVVFGDANRVALGLEGILNLDVVFLGAEDDADRRLVVRCAFPVVEQVQVEIHFAGMFGLEGGDLEVEGDQRPEKAVIEEQVYKILLVA